MPQGRRRHWHSSVSQLLAGGGAEQFTILWDSRHRAWNQPYPRDSSCCVGFIIARHLKHLESRRSGGRVGHSNELMPG